METRVCSKCNTPKPIEDFRLRNRLTRRRQSYCNDCEKKMGADWYERNKEYQKANAGKHRDEYRQRAREYGWDYLSTHPCVGPDQTGCPYHETDPHVLEFHHVGNKTNEVSHLIARGAALEVLQAEIRECIVLCSNCHRRLTAKQQGWFRR